MLRWGYNSVAEPVTSIHEALAWVPCTANAPSTSTITITTTTNNNKLSSKADNQNYLFKKKDY